MHDLAHRDGRESVDLKQEIFESWTGIDQSIYGELTEIDRMWETLLKELAILAELVVSGASQDLIGLVESALAEEKTYEQVAADFNSIVEYGRHFAELSPEEKSYVLRREIQEEFGHFWRIMGIESMFRTQVKKVVGEVGIVMEIAGNLERELGVICERRINRGVVRPYLPVKKDSVPESNVRKQSDKAMTSVRNNYPYVSVSISSEEPLPERTGEMLKLLDILVTKYPLEKAVALFDFILSRDEDFMKGINFTIIQEFTEDDASYVKGLSVGKQMFLHTRRNGDFTHTLKAIHRGEGFHFGSSAATKYQTFLWPVEGGNNIYALSVRHADIFEGMEDNVIEEILNSRSKKGKILPVNNMKAHAKTGDNGVVRFVCKTREDIVHPDFSKESIFEQLEPLTSFISGRDANVSIEGAHVHADRAISEMQAIGARIAAAIQKCLSGEDSVRTSVVAMVDDDHVVNSFDYNAFEEMLTQETENGIDEIVFESSPLIYSLSLDILKLLIEICPEKLKRVGNNLYIEIDDEMVIELVEDLEGEFITGCVLFDAAFSMYKLFPTQLNRAYQERMAKESSSSPDTQVSSHNLMLDIYKATNNPEERQRRVNDLLPKEKVSWDMMEQNSGERPMLDEVYRALSQDAQSERFVIMVLEATYHSQQKKLASLSDLLGVVRGSNIISVMFNSESGAITLDR